MIVFRVLGKFRLILSRHQKVRIFELAILMIFGGLIEMLSVSLMLPFIDAVMNPDKMMEKAYIQKLCEVLRIRSDRMFLIFIVLVLALIYILTRLYNFYK